MPLYQDKPQASPVTSGGITIGTTTVTGGTSGSVLFVDSTGFINQDNANFNYNDSTNILSLAGLSLPGLTAGSILFLGTGGAVEQDNSNLFWDNTNNRLGIGTATPAVRLDVRTTGGAGEIAYFLDSATNGFVAGTSGTTAYFSSSSGATPLAFGINGATDSIFIKTDKYVGIRNTNPTAYLHITGQTLYDYLLKVTNTTGDNMLTIRSDINTPEGVLAKYGFMSENTGSFQVAGFGATFGGDRVHLYSGAFLYTDGTTSGMIMGIGSNPAATNPNASALLHMNSTTKGFLPPQMRGSEAEAISSPANGLLIFCNDGDGATITSTGWWGYDGGWVKLN